MKRDPFIVILFKWICWSYVMGIGIANIIGPQEKGFLLKLWFLSGVFLVFSVYLYFSLKDFLKYSIAPVLIILGITSYQLRYNVPNTDSIKKYIDNTRWERTIIRGIVVKDPDIRDKVTHVVIKPDEVIPNPVKSAKISALKGKTGNIILFISENIRNKNTYYDKIEFGDRIEVKGNLSKPMQLTNKHGFNYEKYLKNRNIYANMYIGSKDSIKFLGKSSKGLFRGLKGFAYKTKKKMILGIKKTIPPPASALIGAVTIGARGGIPEVIRHDFQATGVSHVLALSGLHVGFLAFMLIMIFNSVFKSQYLFYKLPTKLAKKEVDLTAFSKKLIPIFVIAGLIMFSIITGGRPSTVRAVIMFSMAIVLYFWFGVNLYGAGRITIPISAAIMLAFNPLLIFDASFALSFTAVWSIIYLSDPLRQVFSRVISGWGQVVFLLFLVSIMPIIIIFPWLFSNGRFIWMYLFIFFIFSGGAYMLEKKYPLTGFEFEGWWPVLTGFFCVQAAIQIGMMWPLSGVYFNRFPVAGVFANFIAIPLIGIIVPLGLISELLTFIPVVGSPMGLAVGAAATLFSNAFLSTAKFFRMYFPYPVQSAQSAGWLAAYYTAVIVFAFNKRMRRVLTKRFKLKSKLSNWIVAGLIILIFSSGYWAKDLLKRNVKEKGELIVTVLDVGFGNCILIQTPSGKNILIDGGSRGDKRYWTTGKWGKGRTVILPNLSGYNISKLDKIVITNPLPENVGGLIYVLNNFNVKEVWDSLNPKIFSKNISYHEFLKNINDIYFEMQKDRSLPIGVYLNYYDFLNTDIFLNDERELSSKKIFKKRAIPHYWFYEGIIIHREKVNGKTLELKALNPPKNRIKGTEKDLLNNSAVLKLVYGNSSFLIPSDILSEGEGLLADKYNIKLKADVLLIPNHGSFMASSNKFLKEVRPSYAIVQFDYLKGRSFKKKEVKRILMKYENRGIKTFGTDSSGAIEIRTDGKKIDIKTVLGEDQI